jgi:predicted HTH domain antitoxin
MELRLRTTIIAIKLFQEGAITLEKAAKMAGVTLESFIEKLSYLGIPAVTYSADEVESELKDFG